jgi:hypothetical protein
MERALSPGLTTGFSRNIEGNIRTIIDLAHSAKGTLNSVESPFMVISH